MKTKIFFTAFILLAAIVQNAQAQNWLLLGNTGTTAGTNFIGTKDAKDVVFKAYNVEAGRILYSSGTFQFAKDVKINGVTVGRGTGNISTNTAVGSSALNLNTTGSRNTTLGYQSLYSNTTGSRNTALGYNSLFSNTTRSNLVAVGDSALYNNGKGAVNSFDATQNTAVGSKALYSNTTGGGNTATGFNALKSNTTGTNNTANGSEALKLNRTGSYNTATGSGALNRDTSGSNNTATGQLALYYNQKGNYNTATGSGALLWNATGDYNTANGYQSLYGNTGTSGSYNTANGSQSLFSNIGGNLNTANGYKSLFSNTSGNYNTATGSEALKSNNGSSNTANGAYALFNNINGASNTGIGNNALFANTSGGNNTAIGYQSLFNNTTGQFNTANGAFALNSTTTGSRNTANGYEALRSIFGSGASDNTANGYKSLYSITTGYSNTANGVQALYSSNTGYDNTANGYKSLYSNTTGYRNTANGHSALTSNTTGNSNTGLGYYANVSANSNFTKATAIGANSTVNASNKMQLGASTTTLSTSGSYTIVSDARFKDEVKIEDAPGLDFINQLQPVTYNFNYKRYDDFLRKDIKEDLKDDDYQQQLIEKGKERQVGFIAQEVDKMCKENKFTFNGIYTPQNSGDNYALDYSRFVVPLVKAVQELSADNEQKQKEIEDMKAQMQEFQSALSQCCTNFKSSVPATDNGQQTTADAPKLDQNVPNPFSQNTTITCYVPSTAKASVITVYNLQGNELKSFTLGGNGVQQVMINGGALPAGDYLYTLIIDGQKIDTKKMTLTKE